jgi:hypothetical protein
MLTEQFMEIVQRIMGKLVGEEISVEEQEEVSGALKDSCETGFPTWGGEAGGASWATCDHE